MKNKIFKTTLLLLIVSVVFWACKNNSKTETQDTILTGNISIYIDQSVFPIVEDEVMVFENSYQAKLNLTPTSEIECINALTTGKTKVLVLPRKLTEQEHKIFSKSKVTPTETPFATDGIALISNQKNDSLISLTEIKNVLKNNPSKIKGLVFDNANSSTINYLMKLAGVQDFPKDKVFTLKTNEEVVKYVSENQGLIGVVGLNWLTQPSAEIQSLIDKVYPMYLQHTDGKYYYPSQENLAAKKYALARDLYIINCQGYDGLGTGFASFVAGEIGQRIVLKSGLAPTRIPSRKIVTRNSI